MHDQRHDLDDITGRGAALTVWEADRGAWRTAELECWRQAAEDAGWRTWLLSCHPIDGGIWAGVADLVESVIAQPAEAGADLLAAHGYEIGMVLPRYRERSEVIRPLTDTAPPEEQTRNYAADRAYRSLHGLVDLLSEWYDTGDGRPWAIACDDFDHANGMVVRFFTELTRRRGRQLGVRLLVATEPGHGDDLAARFAAPVTIAVLRPLDPHPRPSAPTPPDPEAMASLAAQLERQIERDPAQIGVTVPRLIDAWQHSTQPQRALRWQVDAVNAFNHDGLYEASLPHADAIEANLDRLHALDRDLYFAAVHGLFFCWVPLGQVERARTMLAGALSHLERSTLPRVYYLMAMLHARFLDAADLDQAEHYLQAALEIVPEVDVPEDDRQFLTVFLLNGLALVRVRQHRPQDAVELCQAGLIRLDDHLLPNQHRLHRSVLLYNIAQVYVQIGLHDLALEYFTQTMALDPNYSEYYNERGTVYFKMGRFEAAEADYLKAVRLSPPYPEVHTNLGQCYRATGRTDAAIAAYSRALDLDPGDGLALAGRADAYHDLGNDELALADYNEALRLAPAQPTLLAGRAIIHFQHGQVRSALDDLDQAIGYDPHLGVLYHNRAVALLAMGRTDDATDDLRGYLERCPDAADRLEVEHQLGSLNVHHITDPSHH